MGVRPYVGRVPATPSRAALLGALVLLLRPTYIAAEVVTAAATTGGYSFVADSVSRLGEVGCTAAYCSPRHEVMNGAFMVYGVALAVGALLLARQLGPWVTGLLVVSGLSSYATGLAPLDQDATLHALAAAPLFVAQPLALLLLGGRVRGERWSGRPCGRCSSAWRRTPGTSPVTGARGAQPSRLSSACRRGAPAPSA